MALDTEIAGLTIEFSKISSYLYAHILYKESGLRVMSFTNEPLPFGKREFVKRVNQSTLSKIDWTKSVEELSTQNKLSDAMFTIKRDILKNEFCL